MKVSVLTKNFTALLSSNFIVQGLRFAVVVLLARRLGAELFGVYNYLVLLVSFGFTLTEFGLRNLAIREISQGRGSSVLIKQIFKVRLVLASVSILGVLAAAHFAFPQNSYFLVTLVLSLSLFADALFVDFMLISGEKMVAQSYSNVAQSLFLCVTAYIFVHSPGDIETLAFLFLLSHILWAGLLWFFSGGIKFSQSENEISAAPRFWKTAKSGMPLFVAQFVGGIQFGIDLLLLGQFHYDSILGEYGASLKILGILVGVINALVNTVQPRLARHSHDFSGDALQLLVKSTTRLIWMIVLPASVACFIYSRELVSLFFGTKYLLAAEFLKPLSIALSLYCLGLPPMHALFISHRTREMVKIVVTNALISFLIIGLLLYFGKIELVPWGMIVCHGVYLFSGWRLFHFKGLFSFEEVRNLFLPSVLMIIALKLLTAPLLGIVVATLAYALGLFIIRIWERDWFKEVLG